MQNTSDSSYQQQQSKTLLLFLVVVSYIITFATWAKGGERYLVLQLTAGIIFRGLYLAMNFFDVEILRRFSIGKRNAIYFSVQLTLVLGIGLTLGPGGNWLFGVPLAGIAVERLSPRWRWPVYIGVLLGFVLPILRYSTWDFVLLNSFVISTAIAFMVIFSQVRLNEHVARKKAEGPSSLRRSTCRMRLSLAGDWAVIISPFP